jgi:S1-C subfamily serine protease
MRRISILFGPVLLFAAARPSSSQVVVTAETPASGPPLGCRGDRIEFSTVGRTAAGAPEPVIVAQSYPIVRSVQPGSPAEIAGIRPGDMLISQNGIDYASGTLPRTRRVEGDTLRLVVERNRSEYIPITLVLGHREPPAEGSPPAEATCTPLVRADRR